MLKTFTLSGKIQGEG